MKTMQFKELLSYLRDRAKYRKVELANKIGVSPSYIMNLESGFKKPPTMDRCMDIARALTLNSDDTNNLLNIALYERMDEAEIKILKDLFRNVPCDCKKLTGSKKVVIRINKNGNAEIVSKDVGVSIDIRYEDEEDGFAVPMTKHKLEPIKTEQNRISRHAHHDGHR